MSLTGLLLYLGLITVSASFLNDPPFIFTKDHEEISCSDAITNALLNFEELSDAFYILSSGKFLDNWGSYDSCIKSAMGSDFWMITTSGNIVSETGMKSFG